MTEKWRLPLPRPDDILDWLQQGKYYTAIDLRSGYYQIPVHPDDIPKTAMTTPFGQYQYKRIPFGLTAAPAAFTDIMSHVLKGLRGEVCEFYIDNVIISSPTFEQHLV